MVNPVEALATCTVRLVGSKGGKQVTIGTGFLYAFVAQEPTPSASDGVFLPVVISNKHVLDGCDSVAIRFTVAEPGTELNHYGQPTKRRFLDATVAIEGGVVMHPAPEIDLCAFPVGMIVNDLKGKGLDVHHTFLTKNYRLSQELMPIIRAVEPIAMVGYPNGIWDSKNNAPIVRRGSTATHPLVRYEGRPEFLIDAACFPGSSGSPIFLFEDGMYRTENGAMTPGTRIKLLGILYAGPQFTAEGRLEPRPIPHSVTPTPVLSMPMNLGFAIHADELDALERIFVGAHNNAKQAGPAASTEEA